jgi:hypothetical protein
MNLGIGNERPINHAQWKKRKGNNRSVGILPIMWLPLSKKMAAM